MISSFLVLLSLDYLSSFCVNTFVRVRPARSMTLSSFLRHTYVVLVFAESCLSRRYNCHYSPRTGCYIQRLNFFLLATFLLPSQGTQAARRHWTDLGPTSANDGSNIGPTSANHARATFTRIGPTSASRLWADAGLPASGRRGLASVGPRRACRYSADDGKPSLGLCMLADAGVVSAPPTSGSRRRDRLHPLLCFSSGGLPCVKYGSTVPSWSARS